ncbi:MAG: hypothetical protein ACTHWW_05920 [Arthrobacter sp.]|uniref:hypothetical protein n=1 Tax=Arthrobacter TaxID=1663 RepID=UPI00264B212B|nr:hypothetical protein [Micrococcaceae bacterium]MDN5812352.1 hypothetical protein [Micrococcaceae bacterium]MDN5823466.1 hypothetical protein [Micrococcaceae bacterium]MDN5878715.1 hypothetical protein [Micrococcaceae bacterium]MDN5886239.1 hypothetical protein [Micrococcaceae bacterium]
MKRISIKLMIYGVVIFIIGVALQLFSMNLMQYLFDTVDPEDMVTANALRALSTIFSTAVIPLGVAFIAASVVVRMLENHLRLDERATPAVPHGAAGDEGPEVPHAAATPAEDDEAVETFSDDFYRR